MDDKSVTKEKVGIIFSNTCNLYRNLPPGTYDVVKKEINPAAFCAKKNNAQLSTDWDLFSTPEASLIRVGLTYKYGTTTFKDHTKFQLCMLNIKEIRELCNVKDIIFSPIWHSPEITGAPNNLSHTDVCYEDVELRIKMKGIAKLVQELDFDFINDSVLEGRK